MLAPVDPAIKYSSFIAPKNQITTNQEDIQQEYGLRAASLTVELAPGLAGKFNMNYLVEKTVHRWDGIYGFRTSFEARAIPEILLFLVQTSKSLFALNFL